MRVAQEVRKRMDEAQKEIEKNALSRPLEEEEEDDEPLHGRGAYGGDPERRSVREKDRDLLEGAEAVVAEPMAEGRKNGTGEGDLLGLESDVAVAAAERGEGKQEKKKGGLNLKKNLYVITSSSSSSYHRQVTTCLPKNMHPYNHITNVASKQQQQQQQQQQQLNPLQRIETEREREKGGGL
ncbi:MAG: hypothetical protein Q9190_007916 [Brigantiaea leucoxantha]